jgi:hypothetical protein
MSGWQKAQGAKCGCRGQDEMCPCQNVDFSAPSWAVNQSQARVSGDELAIAAMDLCNALYGLGYGQMGAPGLPGEIDTLTDLLERWNRPAPVSPADDSLVSEIRDLLGKATAGPWVIGRSADNSPWIGTDQRFGDYRQNIAVVSRPGPAERMSGAPNNSDTDAALIVSLRNHIEGLLDSVDGQRELLRDCLMSTGTPGDQMDEETLADLPDSIERISRIAGQTATLRSQLELATKRLREISESDFAPFRIQNHAAAALSEIAQPKGGSDA